MSRCSRSSWSAPTRTIVRTSSASSSRPGGSRTCSSVCRLPSACASRASGSSTASKPRAARSRPRRFGSAPSSSDSRRSPRRWCLQRNALARRSDQPGSAADLRGPEPRPEGERTRERPRARGRSAQPALEAPGRAGSGRCGSCSSCGRLVGLERARVARRSGPDRSPQAAASPSRCPRAARSRPGDGPSIRASTSPLLAARRCWPCARAPSSCTASGASAPMRRCSTATARCPGTATSTTATPARPTRWRSARTSGRVDDQRGRSRDRRDLHRTAPGDRLLGRQRNAGRRRLGIDDDVVAAQRLRRLSGGSPVRRLIDRAAGYPSGRENRPEEGLPWPRITARA